MPDMENVIKGLEELEGFLFKEYTNIKAEESKIYYDRFKSLSDALELLKKQVPIEPESFMDGLVKRYSCKTCGKHLVIVGRYHDGYCSKCGQAVKWE